MIKRLVCAAVLFIAAANFASAQDQRYDIAGNYIPVKHHEFSLSYGFGSVARLQNVLTGLYSSDIFVELDNIISTGGMTLGYNYRFSDLVGVGISFVYTGTLGDIPDGRSRRDFYSFMPQVKVNWLDRGLVTLYSRLSLGAGFVNAQYDYTNDAAPTTDRETILIWQVSPIGIEVGRSLAGYAEAGFGISGIFMLGVRYKF